MRLLYVATAYEPAWNHGGPPRSASSLCRALTASGLEVSVFTTDDNVTERLKVPTGEPVQLGGVMVRYFRAYGGPRLCFAPGLLRALQTEVRRADLVHVDSFWQYPGLAAVIACRQRGVRYVVSPRGSLIAGALQRGSPLKRLHARSVGAEMVNSAAAVHLTTELEREESLQALHDVATFVVPNPVDLSGFVPRADRAAFRAAHGIPEDAFVLIYSGRLHPRKALPVLLHAAARARHSGIPLHLLLAGPDGPGSDDLKTLSRDLRLDTVVHFLGTLSRARLADAVGASDAVALVPYAGENFGNACVEAMGLGLPAILSFNVGIAREAEADGAAMVVTVDEMAVAGAICRLAEDVCLRRDMGEAAARLVETRFSPAAVAHAMTQRYSEAMA